MRVTCGGGITDKGRRREETDEWDGREGGLQRREGGWKRMMKVTGG